MDIFLENLVKASKIICIGVGVIIIAMLICAIVAYAFSINVLFGVITLVIVVTLALAGIMTVFQDW
jgi:hypothetical protein